jgi:DNA repair exonuclease SbcCD nuclease subunit
MSLYVTGDIHGWESIKKLNSKNWPTGMTLTKDDYLVILGDFGLVWHNNPNKEEEYWTNWLSNKPWTTLFVDGNHENFERLYTYDSIPMFDSEVREITSSIYQLKRGHIYNIDDKTIFTMGGATSIDKHCRQNRISWWEEEIPSYEEFDLGFKNLDNYDSINYIFSHTGPLFVCDEYIKQIGSFKYEEDDTVERYLQMVVDRTEFDGMYFGHWHDEWDYGKYHMVYDKIVKVF